MRKRFVRAIAITAMMTLSCPIITAYGENQAMNSVKENTATFFVAQELAAGRRPNRLIGEKSPYLLQHAFNPVEWNPWGEAAFDKARQENKPIFLSIGYSTCHWCHVMEHESFEDPKLADILNRYFICIKVDREERPDLDQIYMAVTQAMTGSGGWPMSVFLTPDLNPFYAGTYFPPQSSYGRPGFADLLETIHNAWQKDHLAIVKQSSAIMQHLADAQVSKETTSRVDDTTTIGAAAQLSKGYDRRHGGFGDAPKFPRPVALNFLLRYGQRTGDQQILEMIYNTLRKMAAGGVYDQLAGGFHRYSVDAAWRVPHFEKMLYDQALLIPLYLEASQLSRDPYFTEVAARTLDYTLKNMRRASGAFFSAEDADSPLPENPAKLSEGAYYLWTDQEIGKLLSADEARLVRYRFGVEPKGNAPDDPHGDFREKNILYLAKSIQETAQAFKIDEKEAQ
ncbi:MAG: thioredoxin domain-containing protein, partial [Desulfobulbaceae bacterium]|nr:thioredoxin domain-containing protein [Desulfobulbaceae bacterium]